MDGFHLAQVNVARLRAPLDSPVLSDFVAALDPVNALADRSPGFVWRLQTEAGNATDVHVFDDDLIIVNLSVWEDLESLTAFVYRTAHRDVMLRRREWFERMAEAYLALWWIPAGTLPSPAEAVERLEHLRAHGPSPYTFTFKTAADFSEGNGVSSTPFPSTEMTCGA